MLSDFLVVFIEPQDTTCYIVFFYSKNVDELGAEVAQHNLSN